MLKLHASKAIMCRCEVFNSCKYCLCHYWGCIIFTLNSSASFLPARSVLLFFRSWFLPYSAFSLFLSLIGRFEREEVSDPIYPRWLIPGTPGNIFIGVLTQPYVRQYVENSFFDLLFSRLMIFNITLPQSSRNLWHPTVDEEGAK